MVLQTLNLNGFGSKHGRPLDLIIWLSMHLILWSNLSLWLAHITKLMGPKFEIWIPHWKSMTINVHTAQYTLKKRDPLSLPSTSTVFFPHPIFSLSYSPHPPFLIDPLHTDLIFFPGHPLLQTSNKNLTIFPPETCRFGEGERSHRNFWFVTDKWEFSIWGFHFSAEIIFNLHNSQLIIQIRSLILLEKEK